MTGQFARIPMRAFGARKLGADDLRVLMAIAIHADREGNACPSQGRIAKLAGMPRKNVPRSVSAIEAEGLIQRQRRPREGGGWDQSIYKIIFDDVTDNAPIDTQTIKKEAVDEKSREVADSMLAIWRAECGNALSIPRLLASDRVTACQARFKDSFDRDLEQWRLYCQSIVASAFCCGGGANGWRADLDWALRPRSIRSVREGKYQSQERRGRRNGTTFREYEDYEILPLGPGGT
jgi:hypothetical protein